MCGQRDLVPCPLQPLAQARERRDIAPRTRRHNQNPHQATPVDNCEPPVSAHQPDIASRSSLPDRLPL
jgi:hypothetical protein